MLSVIETEALLDCDELTNKDLPLQQYGARIEKLSQQDRLSKFCVDAGFLNVVEIQRYFTTKDTAEVSQFTDAVACREDCFSSWKHNSDPRSKRANRLRTVTKIKG